MQKQQRKLQNEGPQNDSSGILCNISGNSPKVTWVGVESQSVVDLISAFTGIFKICCGDKEINTDTTDDNLNKPLDSA